MIKKSILGLLAALIIVATTMAIYFWSLLAHKPNTAPPISSTLYISEYQNQVPEAQHWLSSHYREQNYPSLSAAVGHNGNLIWAGAIGYANLKALKPASTDTLYRIASIAKPMTAVAAMRMHEKGLINIEDPFSNYISEYPQENAGFSLKQLLSHQSGVRHYYNQLMENFSNKEYQSTQEATSIFKNDPLVFQPGAGFHYSTYGYTLLALAMESAYAQEFENIMTTELFSPANLKATFLDRTEPSTTTPRATAYLQLGESLLKAPQVNLSYKYAGGGYISIPSDIVQFANALLTNKLLSERSLEKLWTVTKPDGIETNYALGFRVGQDEWGAHISHGGKGVGGYAFMLIYPETNVVVAFTANVTPSGNKLDRLKVAKDLANIFSLGAK